MSRQTRAPTKTSSRNEHGAFVRRLRQVSGPSRSSCQLMLSSAQRLTNARLSSRKYPNDRSHTEYTTPVTIWATITRSSSKADGTKTRALGTFSQLRALLSRKLPRLKSKTSAKRGSRRPRSLKKQQDAAAAPETPFDEDCFPDSLYFHLRFANFVTGATPARLFQISIRRLLSGPIRSASCSAPANTPSPVSRAAFLRSVDRNGVFRFSM